MVSSLPARDSEDWRSRSGPALPSTRKRAGRGRLSDKTRRIGNRSSRRGTLNLHYAGERDLWECDFMIPDAAIQVCLQLTPANRARELRGVCEAARLHGRRRAVVVTLDQTDRLIEDGTQIEVVPAWRWMA